MPTPVYVCDGFFIVAELDVEVESLKLHNQEVIVVEDISVKLTVGFIGLAGFGLAEKPANGNGFTVMVFVPLIIEEHPAAEVTAIVTEYALLLVNVCELEAPEDVVPSPQFQIKLSAPTDV